MTAAKMRMQPVMIRGVICSLKTNVPMMRAVIGSSAPKTALGVGPMVLMALLIKRMGITVGTSAAPSVLRRPVVSSGMGCSVVPQPVMRKKSNVPPANTQNVSLPEL